MNRQNIEISARLSARGNHQWYGFLLMLLVLVGASGARAQSPAPVLFFTDLTSGPNSGGESVSGFAGAYVTIYGNYFGSTQGTSTVTLNGASCLRVVSWGTTWLWYQKLVVQLGSSCTTGTFAVTTSAGTSNNSSFTVRSGNIYCISTGGNDSNSGKFPAACWATLAHASSTMVAGDTVYLENGVSNKSVSNYSAVVNITASPGGAAASPIAFVAYPGATATIGANNAGLAYAIRVPQIGVNPAYYVIAGLTLRGNEALEIFSADHFYMIGNDLSCDGAGGYSCAHMAQSTNQYFNGNNVHDYGFDCASNSGTCKLYHGVYHTTNTNHVFEGWNLVDGDPTHSGVAGCRGIQFYSTGGSDQFDLHVHDNIIRNTICDGLNFQTVNPNNGPVEAYNNSIYHAGTGPDPSGQLSAYACLYLNSSSSPTTKALVYNNSFYDCGSRGGTSNVGIISAVIPTTFTNNTAQSTGTSEPYFSALSTSCSSFNGSNNNWFGAGSAPCASNISASLNVNPQYVSTALGSTNLSLSATSPLIGAGTASNLSVYDITGLTRPASLSIGAFEYFSGIAAQRPNPPTNLSITVQ